ncbi:MAG: hypothetical protein AUF65_01595 [Chloroflexi bacterium 13_1_20CM_50_12]|nr:MAG: hypothetical protein AUF65_01595 [Chloroflexi bacterium 13_1_20CM_50_12]
MTQATIVEKHLATVTNGQLNKCTRLIDNRGVAYYKVANSKGALGHDGNLIEYTVTASRHGGIWYIACTCKSGKSNSGICWHKKASVAHGQEFKAAQLQKQLNEMTELQLAASTVAPAMVAPAHIELVSKAELARQRKQADAYSRHVHAGLDAIADMKAMRAAMTRKAS